MYISIIVPVYNVEHYLDECVESLIKQNLSDDQYEILLIDDGSTDCSGKKCDIYSRKYKNICSFHKENGGLSDARNFGFGAAKGKYILFVDADDYIKDDSLNRLVQTSKEQHEPDIVFLQAKKLLHDGSLIEYDCTMEIDELKKDKLQVLAYLSNRKMFPASAWSKMVKAELLRENNISFKKGQLSEDYEWSLSLFMSANSYGAYNGDYYFYRQNRKGSITQKMSEKHFTDLLAIIESFKAVADCSEVALKEIILKFAAYIYRCMLWNAAAYYKMYEKEIMRNKSLLRLRDDKEIKIIRKTSDLVGMRETVILLNLYRIMRK